MSGVVLTHLLTSTPDPQRGVRWPADPTPLLPLVTTAQHHGSRVVILHDEDLTENTPAETVRVDGWDEDVYWRRWRHTLEWLTHNEPDEVFITDGSDVTMLRSPWGSLEAGKVYIGSERTPLGNRWMIHTHPHHELQHFIRANPRATLYNAGIVGGKRADALAFVTDLVNTYDHLRNTGEVGSDMGTLNLVAHRWRDRVVTGPRVHTEFKAYRDNGTAWWAHK